MFQYISGGLNNYEMVFRRFSLTLFVLVSVMCLAYGQSGRNQHNFAQTYFGVQTDFMPGLGEFNPLGAFRFNIGGLHFWKHADFYVSFPLTTLGPANPEYSEGVLTGARYLPLALGEKAVSPFVGTYWCTPSLKLNNGAELQKNNVGMEAGIYLSLGRSLTGELQGRYNFGQSVDYPLPESQSLNLTMPEWTISFSLKKYIDTTVGLSSEAGKKWIEKREQELTEEKKLSVFSAGIGLSANIQLSPFNFLDPELGLPKQAPNALFPDIGIGYYFYQPDMGIRLSYRPMNLSNAGYGSDYSFQQHRLLIEGFKFLFDYNGFAPFLGLGVGADYGNLSLSTGGEMAISESEWLNSYAIVFGWDIRPSRVDTWYLRTNLRYIYQNSAAEIKIGEQHLEVNFIQFVIYPGRI